jgi:hypothetical protein
MMLVIFFLCGFCDSALRNAANVLHANCFESKFYGLRFD